MRTLKCLLLILSFLFLACAGKSGSDGRFVALKIYHTNDIHSHLIPNNLNRGGIAYLASILRLVRSQESEALILDAGDMYKKGHLPARKTQDEVMADLVTQMPYFDARAVGNNEIKLGVSKLIEWSKSKEKAPLLSANFVDKEGKPVFAPSIILTKAGLKVGVIGLTYEGTFDETETMNLQPDPKKDPRSPYKVALDEESLRPLISSLRAQVDVLILLSHEDFKKNKSIARKFPEIDLFVCGHSHILTPEQKSSGKALLVESGEFGQQLGVVTLVYDKVAKKVTSEESVFWPVGAELQIAEPHIEKAISAAYKKYAPEASETLGNLSDTMTLLHASQPFEGSLQDWVSDVILEASHADASIVNRDMLREDLVEGIITKESLSLSAPYDDTLIVVKLQRLRFEKMLKAKMISEYHVRSTMPFGFSKIKSTVTIDSQADEVKNILVSFDSKKDFLTVAMPKYMTEHCESFFDKNYCPLKVTGAFGNVSLILADYVKKHKDIEPPLGNRVHAVFDKDTFKTIDAN
jgi:5'-nucleotidase/UDP-sugar diphosphatase